MHKLMSLIAAFVAATASAAIPSSERAALLLFYETTSGPQWVDRTNWGAAEGTECTWKGVICNEAQTAVAGLDLAGNGLRGPFPIAALVQLPSIREVWLSDNALTGPLPAEISRVRSLEAITLSENPIGGSIPKELADLPSLRAIGMWSAGLSGSIPAEIWNMSQLRELALADNELSGTLPPEIARLTNLEHLSLGTNGFTGALPQELGSLRKLGELWLESNSFSGPIPPSLGQLESLTVLSLWDNELTGSIPVALANLRKLEHLSLFYNKLTGPIPAELGDLPSLTGLFLQQNELTGTLPATLARLTKLEYLFVSSNRLTGQVPDWIGTLGELRGLSFGDNDFSGPLPPSIWNLTKLEGLDFGVNRITGSLPAAIGNLTKLESLSMHYTSMSGPLPPEIGRLTNLVYLFASSSGLTGRIPSEIGNLRKAEWVWLDDNSLEGSIPPEIGNLESVAWLELSANRLSGAIPPEIGNLRAIRYLDLDTNALRGQVPREITRLTTIGDGSLNLSMNALRADDPEVAAFIGRKDFFGIAAMVQQTIHPKNVRVVGTTDRSARIAWDGITHYGPGGIQVVARPASGSAPVSLATTQYIFDTEIVVFNLAPETSYSFTVSTITYPSSVQKNLIVSDPAPAVTATTAARVLGPADIEVTERTGGLVQLAGAPQNEDHFTVANVGDTAADIDLEIDAPFATVSPSQFRLEPGASRTINIKSLPQPAGYYYGSIWIRAGSELEFVTVSLFSAQRLAGAARAEPVESRVDIAGEPGSDSVGQARFRNVGSAMLSGILVSDQPWVVPDEHPVFISPGQVGAVTFRVIRARRPEGAEGALVANLKLIYVDAGSESAIVAGTGAPPPNVSVSIVRIVDVSRPSTSGGSIPGLLNQVAYFLPGLSTFVRNQTSFISDVSLLNSSAASAASNVELFFTPAGEGQTIVARLSPIPATTSVTLSNILGSVYQTSARTGTVQIRAANPQGLVVAATLLGSSDAGSVAGDVPLFRSDRSAPPTGKIYLTGVRAGGDLFVQETSGIATTAAISFVDGDGRVIAERTATIGSWGLTELSGVVPSGAATAIVTNTGAGAIAAYARVFDESGADHWSIVDWSRFHDFDLGDAVRIPLVSGAAPVTPPPPPPSGGGRRRAARQNVATPSPTSMSLFNPTIEDVRATVEVFDGNGAVRSREELTIPPSRTVTLHDAGARLSGGAGHAVVTTLRRDDLVVTARGARTAVPVIPVTFGLRAGRTQFFSGLEDSTAATVAAGTPGTHRTTLGLLETGGGSVVVRARVFLDAGRSLASSVVYRDFTLSAGQQLLLENVVRAIVGNSRETQLGELHNLQIRLDVLSGNGAVLPFVITTDNATGDTVLRLE